MDKEWKFKVDLIKMKKPLSWNWERAKRILGQESITMKSVKAKKLSCGPSTTKISRPTYIAMWIGFGGDWFESLTASLSSV